jgi:hypothetical protein
MEAAEDLRKVDSRQLKVAGRSKPRPYKPRREVSFWEALGYPPYVFERVWKLLILGWLKGYRKWECGSYVE